MGVSTEDSGWSSSGRGAKLALEWRWHILSCVALYLPVIKMLHVVMHNKQPFKLRLFTTMWNFMLAGFSMTGALLMLLDDWTIIARAKYEEVKFQPRTRMVVAMFCLTKVVEFGDTMILTLKKRPLIFLHLYHHLTVALYCWHALLLRVSFAHTFVLMNLLVHGAMYLYYGLCGIYPNSKVLRTARPYITLTQLAQMAGGVVLSAVAMYRPDMTPTAATWWNAQLGMVMYISYCFLFASFYVENFHKQFRHFMAPFLLMFHIFAVIGIVKICMHPSWLRLLAEVIVSYVIGGFGITCGAHRLWAHRSYKAAWPFRFLLLVCNSVANQGSIYRWSRDHRCHHKFSDTEKDPHNATRGFFYSHMGWLLLKKPEAVKEGGKQIDCSDLLRDPLVRLQATLDPFWNQYFAFLLPAVYGYYVYNDFWLGFFTIGASRWVITLHATWTVNSVAHLWGARPYNPNIWPRENWLTTLVAVGEGWHNWHHEFPYDYATSEGGIFEQWNPSKVIIDTAAKLGMVWDRKRALDVWEQIKMKRAQKESTEVIREPMTTTIHKRPVTEMKYSELVLAT